MKVNYLHTETKETKKDPIFGIWPPSNSSFSSLPSAKVVFVAAVLALTFAALAGCDTTSPKAEKGPDGTVAYYIQVESSTPGVTIETNNVYAGTTPLTVTVFGNENGTFHNFGSNQYVIRALPLNTNQFLQTQTFRAVSKSSPGDAIPGLIFFDMTRKSGSLHIETTPEK